MTGNEEATQADELHRLLGAAVTELGRPERDSASVFARAARVRRRRRAVVGLAATAVAGLGVFAVALPPGGGRATSVVPAVSPSAARPTKPAPSATPTARPSGQLSMQQLLPPGAGTAVLLTRLNTGNTDGADLDGDYLVRKNGTAGLIRSEMALAIPSNPGCGQGEQEAEARNCTYEDLGGGRGLRIEEFPAASHPIDGRIWGPSYRAIMALGNGRVLFVDAVAGFTGTGAAGPAMAAPPLSRDQLRTLALRPELLVGAELRGQGELIHPPGQPGAPTS